MTARTAKCISCIFVILQSMRRLNVMVARVHKSKREMKLNGRASAPAAPATCLPFGARLQYLKFNIRHRRYCSFTYVRVCIESLGVRGRSCKKRGRRAAERFRWRTPYRSFFFAFSFLRAAVMKPIHLFLLSSGVINCLEIWWRRSRFLKSQIAI